MALPQPALGRGCGSGLIGGTAEESLPETERGQEGASLPSHTSPERESGGVIAPGHTPRTTITHDA